MKGLGGEINASQVVLSSSSTNSRLITKGEGKNTEGKRCYMIPVNGLSKVMLYIIFVKLHSDLADLKMEFDSGIGPTCYLLILSSFQVCKSVLYAAFDVDDTDTECDSTISESDDSEVEPQTEVSAVVCSRISVRVRVGSSNEHLK